ncbi:MAG: response regulator [Caldilineaceae bacterium]
MHILLVEDDDVDAEVVYRFRSRYWPDLIIVRAVDGIAALKLLRSAIDRSDSSKTIAILLALHLPRMNGFEFLQELRLDKRMTSIPVLVMSDTDLPTAQQHVLAAQAWTCVTRQQLTERAEQLLHILALYANRMDRRATL